MSDSNRLKDSLKEDLAKNVCNDEMILMLLISIIVIILNIRYDTKKYFVECRNIIIRRDTLNGRGIETVKRSQ